MKIEDPKNYLANNSPSPLQDGDLVKLSFTLPKLESEIYGTVNDLKGSVPLLLKYGEHPNSGFYKLDESQQNKVVKSFYDFVLSLNENLDDDELYKVALFNIIVTLSYLPFLEPFTPEFTEFVELIGALIVGDDGVDDEEFMQDIDPATTLNRFSKTVEAGQNGDVEPFTKLGLIFPPLELGFKKLASHIQNAEAKVPGAVKKYYWFFKEIFDVMTTQFIVFSKAKTFGIYDDQGWNYINGINKAMSLPLEFSAAMKNLNISRLIREWLPFKEMMSCFYTVNSALNDIRGVIRDVRHGKVSDSTILSKVRDNEGIDLRSAFNSTLNSLHENYRKIKYNMELMESTFPDNTDLKEYITIVKTMMDGQVYGYFGFPYMNLRYGEGGEYFICKDEN